jgi:hypothetical protein
VVLLFDASDSMRDVRSEDEWNFAVDLGETLVAEMSRTSEIGLEVFATKPVRIANPTNEPMNLKTELEALRAHPKALLPAPSRTALWDAVLDSLKMFDRPHLGDAIYVITDGGDNASGASLKQAAQTLKEAGVRLFAFVFVKRSGSTSPEEVLGPSDVLQVVDETGGTAVFNQFDSRGIFLLPKDPAIFDKLGKPSQLGLLLGSQYWRIFNFYRVSIDLPTIVDKRQQLKLGLVGLTKPQQDNIVLKYPHMLVPCQ